MNDLFSPIGDDHEPPKPQPFPVWAQVACIAFPFVIALVVWLVFTTLQP